MRILYLAQRVPYPPDRGDKITTYHEVRHLARRHEVAVACLADGEADLANVAPLTSLTSSIDVIVLRPLAARLRALTALARGFPFTRAYFSERELHARVAARMRAKRFDAIVVYSSGMAQFVEPYRDVPRIMQFADLDSLKWEQYAANSRFPKSWLFRREYGLLLEYERHVATTFSHSLVCTPRELSDFQRLIPDAPASCVSNGVDVDFFRPQPVVKRDHELIFTGVMDYFPNIQGIVWFCESVLPLIRKEVPDVTLTICGARPHARVQSLGEVPGVTVTGRVPDVRPYLAQASVCVVPLQIARGIQNKLMEAMAMALPTVTCTAAFAGIEAVQGKDLFVADTAPQFAAATVRLLRDEELRLRTGQAARACMEANYRWEHQLARLDRVLAAVTSGQSVVRSKKLRTTDFTQPPTK
jgi:sugar transferase (PEP-CTERM/EpsH1 system associated)